MAANKQLQVYLDYNSSTPAEKKSSFKEQLIDGEFFKSHNLQWKDFYPVEGVLIVTFNPLGLLLCQKTIKVRKAKNPYLAVALPKPD